MMMTDKTIHTLLTYFIASIWMVNGLICKVLNIVPRHEEIVASILGSAHSRIFTVLIGFSEIGMAIWILSRIQSRLNAVGQIVIIATMNILELVLVPGLLLWGKANAIFAMLLILVIYLNEFHLAPKSLQRN